jgi:hypothetical protein
VRELAATDYTLATVFEGQSYPQYGLVADAVLALDAAGVGQEAAAAATAVLARDVAKYVSYDDGDPDTPEEIYAGAVAKLLNVAVAQGVDPSSFGGYDLVTTLRGLEADNGRFSDKSTFGDYSNTFGQSLALIGLTRAGAPVSGQARTFLLAQQCDDGGFRLEPAASTCESDPDATAMAVQGLLAVGGATPQVGRGLDHLASIQTSSGGVGGSGPTSGVNANSTGLAGQAFLAGGRAAPSRTAVSYLRTLQYGCALPRGLRGGVAYDRAAFDAQVAEGAGAAPSDQDRRSTAQALLALAGTPLASVTASGAQATAPVLVCAVASPTPTPTPSTTVDATSPPTSGPGDDVAGGDDPADDNGAGDSGGPLAATGIEPLMPVLLGFLLVLLGTVAVVATRRRTGRR